MGLRFRKSVKFGPFRLNFSKSGVGYSVGAKGFRFTKKAGGGYRTTSSIPGTGISYVKDYAQGSTSAHRQKKTAAERWKTRRAIKIIFGVLFIAGGIGYAWEQIGLSLFGFFAGAGLIAWALKSAPPQDQ